MVTTQTPQEGSALRTSTMAPPPLPGGQRVGPYRLCFEIASGGMATVYLARIDLPAGIHRYVALKRIHPHLMKDPVFVEMFQDEARIASQIHHGNVCSVFDFGFADGAYYLAMEYLAGESLSMVRRTMLRSQLSPDADRFAAIACRVIADAAEGIHAAHELCDPSGAPLNVVHRDISPDNVFLTYDGVVKVVDFGIASATRQKHQTRSGVLKGKYAYIQPEVLGGTHPDRGADVWGLAVILWELLTLRQLFNGTTDLDTLRAVLDERVPPPSELRQNLPKELDEIVLRALSRDPARRYQTARELGRDLTRFLAERRMAVGLAELSEFMADLFPGGRVRKQQLLEIAELAGAPPALESTPFEADDAVTCCLTSIHDPPTRKPTRKGFFDILRAHPRSAAIGTLFVTALAGVAAGRSSISEGKALAAAVPRRAPPVIRETASQPQAAIEIAAPRGAPALVANGDNGAQKLVPIRLGVGPYVLEIVPNADTRSDGVVLRIKNGGAAAGSLNDNARSPVVPRKPRTAPQPLVTEPALAKTLADVFDSPGRGLRGPP
jgi:tRNA A-37 threonylcarbamoyl transferase component Bud32